MKKTLTLVGAFVGAALIAFLVGFFSQSGKIKAAQAEAEACETAATAEKTTASANLGLLELYRARAELGRSNFGSAGDALNRAKTSLGGEKWAEARVSIDQTTANVLKQEAGASDEIGAIIKSLEAKGLPARPPAE